MERISYCSPIDLHIAMTGSHLPMIDVIGVVADIGLKGLTQFGDGSMREIALVDDRYVLQFLLLTSGDVLVYRRAID